MPHHVTANAAAVSLLALVGPGAPVDDITTINAVVVVNTVHFNRNPAIRSVGQNPKKK